MPDQQDALERLEEAANGTEFFQKVRILDVRSVCRELQARRKFCEVFDKRVESGSSMYSSDFPFKFIPAYEQLQKEIDGSVADAMERARTV